MSITSIITSAGVFKEAALSMQNALNQQGLNNNCAFIYKEGKLWLHTFTASHYLIYMDAVSKVNEIEITFSLTKSIKMLEDKGDVTITISGQNLIMQTESSNLTFQILDIKVPTFSEKLLSSEDGSLSAWTLSISKCLRIMALNKILAKDAPILCFENSLQLRYDMVWFKFKLHSGMDTTISLRTAKLMLEFLKGSAFLQIKTAERSYCWKNENSLLYMQKEKVNLSSFSEKVKGIVPLTRVSSLNFSAYIKDLASLDKTTKLVFNFNEGGVIVTTNTLSTEIQRKFGEVKSISLAELILPAELANVIFLSLGDTFEVSRGEKFLCLESTYLTVLLAV